MMGLRMMVEQRNSSIPPPIRPLASYFLNLYWWLQLSLSLSPWCFFILRYLCSFCFVTFALSTRRVYVWERSEEACLLWVERMIIFNNLLKMVVWGNLVIEAIDLISTSICFVWTQTLKVATDLFFESKWEALKKKEELGSENWIHAVCLQWTSEPLSRDIGLKQT